MISTERIKGFFEKNREFFNDFILLEERNDVINGGDIDLLWVGSEARLREFVKSNGRLGFHPLLSDERRLLYSLKKPYWIESDNLYIDVYREFFLQTVDGKNLIPYDMWIKEFVRTNYDWHSIYSCQCIIIEVRVLIDLVKIVIENRDSKERRDRITMSVDRLQMEVMAELLRLVFFNFTNEILEHLSKGSVQNLRKSYLMSKNY